MSKKTFITISFLLSSGLLFSQITFQGFIKDTLVPYQRTNTADIDNNGTDDLIIGTIDWDSSDFFPEATKRNMEIYLQSEDGYFVLHQIFKYDSLADVLTIDVVDLNNDNIVELILGYSNKVGIFFQDSLHQFKKHFEYEVYASVKYVSIADINNDSLNDILVSDWAHQEFTILYQKSDGSFNPHKIIPEINGGLYEPELVDINNDGRMDIIYLANLFWDAPIYVLLNDPIHGITNKSIGILKEFKLLDFRSYEVGYVNSDSLIDIVATSGGNTGSVGNNKPQINIFYQEANKTLKFEHKTIDAFDVPAEIKIIDMNEDNINDLIIDHNGWRTVSVYEQSTSENFSDITKLWNYTGNYTSDYSWAFGDFNNDCKTDIFIQALGSIMFYMNTTDFSCNTSGSNEINNDFKDNELAINIYPNPAYDKLFVTLPEVSFKNITIDFYNNLGVLVENNKLNENINEINVANFPSGIYHYIVRLKNRIITNGRIIKI